MNIKKWDFPSFEDWESKKHEWEGQLGDYYCEIKRISWGRDEVTYGIAISTSYVPHNFYSRKAVSESISLSINDVKALKFWYIKATDKVQNDWEQYIKKTYMEDS